jgi:hypothetical protein
MANEKGLVYLIQPAELVGTSRYKIGYSKKSDLHNFRKEYKKGSRFLDIYESEYSPSLVREIRDNFNNKFKLVAGRTYYEGNENDIKKNFNTIINNSRLVININRPMLVSNNDLTNVDRKIVLYNSNNSNNIKLDTSSYTFSKAIFDRAKQSRKYMPNDSIANHTYMHAIMYGQNNKKHSQELLNWDCNNNKSYYEDVYLYNNYYKNGIL